jgi:hypothetical protein
MRSGTAFRVPIYPTIPHIYSQAMFLPFGMRSAVSLVKEKTALPWGMGKQGKKKRPSYRRPFSM